MSFAVILSLIKVQRFASFDYSKRVLNCGVDKSRGLNYEKVYWTIFNFFFCKFFVVFHIVDEKNEKFSSRCNHNVSESCSTAPGRSYILLQFFPRCITIGTFLIIYFVISILTEFLAGENPQNLTLSQLAEGVSKEYTWALRLTINCIGYSALLIPGILIYKYTKHTRYLERSGKRSAPFPRSLSHFLPSQNGTACMLWLKAASLIQTSSMRHNKRSRNPPTSAQRKNAFCWRIAFWGWWRAT